MKNRTFKIVILFGIVLIAGILYALFQYNKPHINVEATEPIVTITANNLIDLFEKDETTATKLYTNEIIEVSGIIYSIEIKDGSTVIMLKNTDQLSGVLCSLSPKNNLDALKLKNGDTIKVKGLCTGFLLDVVLINCNVNMN